MNRITPDLVLGAFEHLSPLLNIKYGNDPRTDLTLEPKCSEVTHGLKQMLGMIGIGPIRREYHHLPQASDPTGEGTSPLLWHFMLAYEDPIEGEVVVDPNSFAGYESWTKANSSGTDLAGGGMLIGNREWVTDTLTLAGAPDAIIALREQRTLVQRDTNELFPYKLPRLRKK